MCTFLYKVGVGDRCRVGGPSWLACVGSVGGGIGALIWVGMEVSPFSVRFTCDCGEVWDGSSENENPSKSSMDDV